MAPVTTALVTETVGKKWSQDPQVQCLTQWAQNGGQHFKSNQELRVAEGEAITTYLHGCSGKFVHLPSVQDPNLSVFPKSGKNEGVLNLKVSQRTSPLQVAITTYLHSCSAAMFVHLPSLWDPSLPMFPKSGAK